MVGRDAQWRSVVHGDQRWQVQVTPFAAHVQVMTPILKSRRNSTTGAVFEDGATNAAFAARR